MNAEGRRKAVFLYAENEQRAMWESAQKGGREQKNSILTWRLHHFLGPFRRENHISCFKYRGNIQMSAIRASSGSVVKNYPQWQTWVQPWPGRIPHAVEQQMPMCYQLSRLRFALRVFCSLQLEKNSSSRRPRAAKKKKKKKDKYLEIV